MCRGSNGGRSIVSGFGYVKSDAIRDSSPVSGSGGVGSGGRRSQQVRSRMAKSSGGPVTAIFGRVSAIRAGRVTTISPITGLAISGSAASGAAVFGATSALLTPARAAIISFCHCTARGCNFTFLTLGRGSLSRNCGSAVCSGGAQLAGNDGRLVCR